MIVTIELDTDSICGAFPFGTFKCYTCSFDHSVNAKELPLHINKHIWQTNGEITIDFVHVTPFKNPKPVKQIKQ